MSISPSDLYKNIDTACVSWEKPETKHFYINAKGKLTENPLEKIDASLLAVYVARDLDPTNPKEILGKSWRYINFTEKEAISQFMAVTSDSALKKPMLKHEALCLLALKVMNLMSFLTNERALMAQILQRTMRAELIHTREENPLLNIKSITGLFILFSYLYPRAQNPKAYKKALNPFADQSTIERLIAHPKFSAYKDDFLALQSFARWQLLEIELQELMTDDMGTGERPSLATCFFLYHYAIFQQGDSPVKIVLTPEDKVDYKRLLSIFSPCYTNTMEVIDSALSTDKKPDCPKFELKIRTIHEFYLDNWDNINNLYTKLYKLRSHLTNEILIQTGKVTKTDKEGTDRKWVVKELTRTFKRSTLAALFPGQVSHDPAIKDGYDTKIKNPSKPLFINPDEFKALGMLGVAHQLRTIEMTESAKCHLILKEGASACESSEKPYERIIRVLSSVCNPAIVKREKAPAAGAGAAYEPDEDLDISDLLIFLGKMDEKRALTIEKPADVTAYLASLKTHEKTTGIPVYPTHVYDWRQKNEHEGIKALDREAYRLLPPDVQDRIVRLHTFSPFVDKLVGKKAYCEEIKRKNERTGREDIQYNLFGLQTYTGTDGKKHTQQGMFQYTIDGATGVWYHRCFKEMLDLEKPDDFEEKMVDGKSGVILATASVEEDNNFIVLVDPLGTIFITDKKDGTFTQVFRIL